LNPGSDAGPTGMPSSVAKIAPTAALMSLLLFASAFPAGAAIVLAGKTPSADNGKPPPATPLVTPTRTKNGNSSSRDKPKRCMTVCARWGQECTTSDRGHDGQTRKCRRTCQQLTEECF